MSRIRFAVVALVAACIAASLVAGAHAGQTRSPVAVQQPAGPDPSLQVTVERPNITTNNSTAFVTYVGNPQDSDRPMYVKVRIRVRVDDRNLRVLVDRDPGTRFDDHLVWQYDFDLAPGDYRLVYGTVGRHSEPGTYPIEISANYWRGDGLVSRSSVQEVHIDPLPPEPRPWWELIFAILGGAVDWVVGFLPSGLYRLLGALAALATILALVVQLLGRERFLAGLRRPFGREGDGTDDRESDDSR